MIDPAIRECRETIAQNSKSFALASKLLPPKARDHAVVVYTWCRRVDDAIDLVEKGSQHAALDRLVEELADVYGAARPTDPVLAAFQSVIRDCAIPHEYPHELLAGMHMDVIGQRYLSMEQLLHYCYRVAGAVGLMMCHVMGLYDQRALRHAAHMGMAMQLTNICRDVREDWSLGRLYIPDPLLASYDLTWLRDELGQPFPERAREPMKLAVAEMLSEADRFYQSGDDGLVSLPIRSALAVRSARMIYSAIGGRVRRQDCDVTAGRAVVPLREKLGLVAQAAAKMTQEMPKRGERLISRRGSTTQWDEPLHFPDDVIPL